MFFVGAELVSRLPRQYLVKWTLLTWIRFRMQRLEAVYGFGGEALSLSCEQIFEQYCFKLVSAVFFSLFGSYQKVTVGTPFLYDKS